MSYSASHLKGNSAWRALSDDEPDGRVNTDACTNLLKRLGLQSPDRVKSALSRIRPLAPEETRRLAIKHLKKGGYGCKGLPDHIVQAMYADYQAGKSLAQVGSTYGRTRQCVYDIFRRAGLQLRTRTLQPQLSYDGRHWTKGRGGYYRPTTGDRSQILHQLIWEAHHGKTVPPGHQVTFLDADPDNLDPSNLTCLPLNEVVLFHYHRRFPDRAHLTPEQRREFWRTYNREYARRRSADFKARGLRSDGKPLRR